MMDAMHVRRHDKPAQDPIDLRRHADVAVVEHRGRIEQDLEDQHGRRGCPECCDDGEFDRRRQQDLDRVKTHAGGHVELEVGMMHAMQPPQRGHGVKEDVLEIDREVEDDDRDDNACPPRQRDQTEKTKSTRLDDECETDSRDRRKYAHEHHVDRHHAEVVRPAPIASNRWSPARRKEFPNRHHAEHAGECAQADQRFVCEQGITHERSFVIDLTNAWIGSYSIVHLNDVRLLTRCQDPARNWRCSPSSLPSPRPWPTRIDWRFWSNWRRANAASKWSRNGPASPSPIRRNTCSTCGARASWRAGARGSSSSTRSPMRPCSISWQRCAGSPNAMSPKWSA